MWIVVALVALGGILVVGGLGATILLGASDRFATAGVTAMAAFYVMASTLLVYLLARQKRPGKLQEPAHERRHEADHV